MKVVKLMLSLFIVLCFSIISWSANDGQVSKIIGKVQFKEGKSDWKTLTVGKKITNDMIIKVDKQSKCVVSIGSTAVELGKSGSYPMGQLLKNPEKAKNFQLSALLNSNVKEKHNKVSAVAGARADENINKHNDPLMLDDLVATGDAIESANYFIKSATPDYEGAIKSLDESRISKLSADKKDDAYHLLGWCQYQVNNMQVAISSFEKAVSLNPDAETLGKSLLFNAMALNSLEKYEDAIKIAQKIISNAELKNYKNDALSICASNYLMLGDEAKAEEYIEELKKANPDLEIE